MCVCGCRKVLSLIHLSKFDQMMKHKNLVRKASWSRTFYHSFVCVCFVCEKYIQYKTYFILYFCYSYIFFILLNIIQFYSHLFIFYLKLLFCWNLFLWLVQFFSHWWISHLMIIYVIWFINLEISLSSSNFVFCFYFFSYFS